MGKTEEQAELRRKVHVIACAALGLDDEDHEDDELAEPLEKAIFTLLAKQKENWEKEVAGKIFIDITTGHEITQMTMKNARHDPKCSSKQGFMCDCEILNSAQHAVDRAKERVVAHLSSNNQPKKGVNQ